jgi:chromosome segregation ATPase
VLEIVRADWELRQLLIAFKKKSDAVDRLKIQAADNWQLAKDLDDDAEQDRRSVQTLTERNASLSAERDALVIKLSALAADHEGVKRELEDASDKLLSSNKAKDDLKARTARASTRHERLRRVYERGNRQLKLLVGVGFGFAAAIAVASAISVWWLLRNLSP